MRIVQLAHAEVFGLTDIVSQFLELLEEEDHTDPALLRLMPAAYPDDIEANREFQRFTQPDLLEGKRMDASVVAEALDAVYDSDARPTATIRLELTQSEVTSWMRTLAAIRLVLATRIGISTTADIEEVDEDDPTVSVYDWLGYRLEMLITDTDQAD